MKIREKDKREREKKEWITKRRIWNILKLIRKREF